jgi:superfamily II DNA or RNA helicase
MNYEAFIESKRATDTPAGFDAQSITLHPILYGFQSHVVRWALARGRAAVFGDCGLGKTLIQLEWARAVHDQTGKNVLILAPLAVAEQTAREAENNLGFALTICETSSDVRPGVNITNYEKLHHFSGCEWGGIVLDESSIIKAFNGKTRKQINEYADPIFYRLACTATPAPNDLIEITNHAEFLGVLSGKEIIALYFTQDGNTTHKWRLKGHAKAAFWRWMANWCVAFRKPDDLGFVMNGYNLPALKFHEHIVDSGAPEGMLVAIEAQALAQRRAARKESLSRRVKIAAELAVGSEPVIVWCDFNDEATELARAIPEAVEIRGSDTIQKKMQALLDFSMGNIRVMITKPSIAGFGMNWQHCARVVFCGLSDSYEQYYQAIRRCWRFGQKRTVDVHLITSQAEGSVRANIERKERDAGLMMDNLIEHMGELQAGRQKREVMEYHTKTETGANWTLMLGDCIERIDDIPDESIGLSVFSPPFPGMYAYTNSPRDIGNCQSIKDMMDHFDYLVGAEKLMRILKPGRSVAIHLCQLTSMKSREGWIGLHDYRGEMIRRMVAAGWIFSGEVTIDKNPQVQAVRNKERGLMFKSLATDSSVMRMALADYMLKFTKPGENTDPIPAGISAKYGTPNGWITEQEWIEWAAPVWYRATKGMPGGIRETDVLNVRQARETDDERHLCPLQLGVIERSVKLWSAPGDTVFSPFAGIGSEGYQSIKLFRKFIGIELKKSYFDTACQNLRSAAIGAGEQDMVALMEASELA